MKNIQFNDICQNLMILFKNILKIKKDIIIITDYVEWVGIYDGDVSAEKSGQMFTGDWYIFINKNKIKTAKELIYTILHELLHVKYPKMTHKKMRRIELKYWGGANDYV